MKLNIGSGFKRIPGFLNLDNNQKCKPDYLVDIGKDKWPFDDNSIDSVIAHHILEHFGEDFFYLMKEMYRVCKDGAMIDILVPFPRHDSFLIDPTHRRSILPQTMAMFSKKHNIYDIESGGRETPLGLIYDIDFEIVNFKYFLTPKYEQLFSQLTEEECKKIVDECFNIIYETQIILMVNKND